MDVQDRRAYPVHVAQLIQPAPLPAVPLPAVATPKRPVGRPKGSRNQPRKTAPSLSPELVRLQPMLQAFLGYLAGVVRVDYLVLDGHFGNYPATWMVLQTGLRFISKLRQDAALFEPFSGAPYRTGRSPKYGPRVDVRRLNPQYLRSETVAKGLRTQIYQATLLNKGFAVPLNVVILLKTNLTTGAQAHVILFSTDLKLAPETVVDYYSLRFQIEFNFRDAKQYWGLDDFMNVKETAVTNAAQLAFFMVNVSTALLETFRQRNPAFSILDLKSHYRGYRYVAETLKLLPQKPDRNLVATLFENIACLGLIHLPAEPAHAP